MRMKKRKIYILNGTSRAAAYGIGTYINQLIHCLKESCMEFDLVHLYGEGNEVSIEQKDGYQIISIPKVPYVHAKSQHYYTRNVAYLLREFIPNDDKIEYIFHLNFMNNPFLVNSLRKMFQCKILLVAHYSNWSFELLGDYRKLKRILDKEVRKRTPEERRIVSDLKGDARMIHKCDKFVCIARHSLESFSSLCGLEKERISLINNALKDSYTPLTNAQKDAIRSKYYINPQVPIILFAGRLDEVKGVSFLIQAFRLLLKENIHARLIIMGDGDYNRWLGEAKDIWTQITFTGRVDKQTLYELYSIASMGLVTSIHEEFGFVAIEMMMHQLPLIVSDVGGLAEIIEDGMSGLKVPILHCEKGSEVDVDSLSIKMVYLIKHKDKAEMLGKNARIRFLEKYELNVFKDAMLKVYQEI